MTEDDFLAHCVAAQTGNPILERVRSKSAEVTLVVYRLVKTALVHALDNAAVREATAVCAKGLEAFSTETGSAVSLTFVEDTVFVCGQLMRASRGAYEAAAELGDILRQVGVSEIAFDRGVTGDQLLVFVKELVGAARERSATRLVERPLPGVAARRVDPRLGRRRADEGATPAQRALRLYSTALVVMRQFYEDVAAGVTVLPHPVKRLAQRMVGASREESPTMLGMTTMAKAHRDEAGRSVQTAILSLAMARQITDDKVALSSLVLAALMSEVGHARVRRRVGDRYLGDAEDAEVPGAAALACVATGGVNPQSAERAVVALEVAWEERAAILGPPWAGRARPLLGAQIVSMARHMLEQMAPRDGSAAAPPLLALERAIGRPGIDPTLAKLLVRAVGVVPVGTVVELTTGAVGVVLGPSPTRLASCTVRVLVEAGGRGPASEAPIDLGAHPDVRIARTVDPTRLPVDWTRPFVDG